MQNRASRIITDVFRSELVHAMETVTGLESLEYKRDTTVPVEAVNFKRLENLPVHKRISEPTKCRLKKASLLSDECRFGEKI